MPRNFRHLNRAEVSQIVTAYVAGETPTAIAERMNIHHSTVIYHAKKHRYSYPADEVESVYPLIKPRTQTICRHPSAKCLPCGVIWDEIRRDELKRIEQLEAELKTANERLRIAGYLVVE